MENYSMSFKKALKETREIIKNMIKKNNQELERLSAAAVQEATDAVSQIDFSKEKFMPFDLMGRPNDFSITKEVPKDVYETLAAKMNSTEMLRNVIELLEKLVGDIQRIINAYNNDKVAKSIDFYLLLIIMEYTRQNTQITPETLAAVFGMNVCAALREHQKGQLDSRYIDDILYFADFYNEDGSFKYNTDELGYLEKLTAFCIRINDEAHGSNIFPAVSKSLALDCARALMKFNMNHFVDVMESYSQPKVSEPAAVNRDSLVRLREYYRGGKVIKVPEDMESFMELLDDCLLDAQEQRFILNLVYAKRDEEEKAATKVEEEAEEDVNLKVLKDGDLEDYIKAKEAMKTLPKTNSYYYLIEQAFESLTATSNLILEVGPDEYLLLTKDADMEYIREFNQSLVQADSPKISTNNLVLVGDYFASDLETLSEDMRTRVLDILSRINKDNRAIFRRIMTSENISFTPYEIVAKNVQVSFVELGLGIYALLGCSIDNSIYRNTINRLIKEDANLLIVSGQMADDSKRNEILLESETLLANLKGETRK